MEFHLPSPLQQINSEQSLRAKVELWVKRDDLIHPLVSGNKWRKLKYNLRLAKELGHSKILSFGGAYSNHIAAMGAIAELFPDLELHALIRGEELNSSSNSTLKKAAESGLQLHFVNRAEYKRSKRANQGVEVGEQWKDFYLIPEGGANEAGVKGCEEILEEIDIDFDRICLSAGTGTTAAGILRKATSQRVMVFPALKGAEFLKEDILSYQKDRTKKAAQLELFNNYHLGGYAKHNKSLHHFIEECKQELDLPLDYIYTAKAFYGLNKELKNGSFPEGSKILFYHSGGLQANESIGRKYSV